MADKTQVTLIIKRFGSPLRAQKQKGPPGPMNLEDLQKKRQERKRLCPKPALLFLMHRKQRSGLHEVIFSATEKSDCSQGCLGVCLVV